MRGGRSSAYLPQSSAAVSLKPDTRPCCVSGCQSCHGKERGAGRQMHWNSSLTPQYDSELGLGQTVLTAISHAGVYLRAQPERRGLSQLAKPARESSVQIRLASLARGCGNRMRDPPGLRARSACEHLRSWERPSTRGSLPAPVLLDQFSWQPLLRTH